MILKEGHCMCFFQELILSSCLITFAYLLYYLFSKKKKSNDYYSLFLLFGFFLCIFFPSLIRFFFLDLFILLAYKENFPKEGVILSLLFICLSFIFPDISLSWCLISSICYFVVYLIFNSKSEEKLISFIIVKGFLSSYFLFSSSSFEIEIFLELILLLVVLSIFLNKCIRSVVIIDDFNHKMTELEKNLFKITHEIKNPIAVCKGYLDMMDTSNMEKVEKYLPIVKNEISRTLVIMDDFMSIRNLSIYSDIMDFCLLLEDVHLTVYFLLKDKGCTLKVFNSLEEIYLEADYDRLKQVFVNLVKNSLEAGAKNISISTKIKNNKLQVIVQDDGEGISEENFKHLGELFFTTKRVGTGVGVHFSKEIIRLHGGSITYTSKETIGTKVKIILPIEKEFC